MATVARENIGLLNDKIIIKVNREDYLPTFEKKLKEYSKTVNIPGFRKGMVPTGMIKKMYGPSIYTDEVLKSVEKQLYTYLDTEKPDIFAQPLALDADIRKLDLNNPAEYEFGFEIGLKPEFSIPALDQAPLTFNKVKVTDEMVQAEVERMLERAAKPLEQETVSGTEDLLTLLFSETNADGEAVEGGINKDLLLGLDLFTPELQTNLTGKKKEDQLTIQLSNAFEADKLETVLEKLGLSKEDTATADKQFQVTIQKVERSEKRELDQTFFNDVFPGAELADEEAFRNKIREELQSYWNSQSRNQLHDQLYHYLLDDTRIEFPAGFLKRWLQTSSEKPKTAEEAEAEFPTFSSQLKWTLINDKLVKENNLQVTAEEVKAAMREEVMRYFGNMNIGEDTSWLDSYIDRMMKDEKQLDATFRRLLTDKVFSFAESQAQPAEKEVTPDELEAMQHHHHH